MNELESQSRNIHQRKISKANEDEIECCDEVPQKVHKSRGISVFERPSDISHVETIKAEVSDAEVQASLAWTRKLMFYFYYALYGVTNVNRSEGTGLKVNSWICRMNICCSFLTTFGVFGFVVYENITEILPQVPPAFNGFVD